jgi:cytochrome b
MPARRPVPVWDFPTRFFHWALVLFVVLSLLTGEDEGWQFIIHTVAGYAVLLLLLFRLIWGFVGSLHSRFTDFVHGRRAVGDYVAQLVRLRPPDSVGHNPLGGWMVVLILVTLTLAAVTGLFSGEEDGGRGVLYGVLFAPGGEGLSDLHEAIGNFVIAIAIIHVIGVLVDWLLTGDNIIRAMVTGNKTLDEPAAAREPALAPAWLAVAAALLVGGAGYYLFQATDFTAPAGETAESGQRDEDREEREKREDHKER